MLISEKYRQIIMKLNNPGRVVGVVPGARESDKYEGIVYIPHNPDTTAILRNIGFKNTPSPITYEYGWPGRYKPFNHQIITTNFLVGHKRAFCLNGVGSGKTLSLLWAADYLMKKGLVKKCLIVSPLSTLERVWGDAIFSDLYHRRYAVLHGTSEKRLKLLRDPKFDFYIINPDGIGIVTEELKHRFDINCHIYDEATFLKNPGASRWKLFDAILKARPPAYLWMATATPTPNNPYEAWGMAKLMGTNKTMSFSRFKEATMQKLGQFRWVPRSGCEALVHDVLSPAVRFKTSDCIDLPPCTYHTRQCELTKGQRKMLADLKNTFTMEANGTVIDAVNAADKLNKALQTICGFVYSVNDEGARETLRLEIKPRLAVLLEILEEVEGKVIVFVPFVELVTILREEISRHATVEVVDGSVSKSKRDAIFSAFQDTAEPRVLLAHPRTMSHGLTLTSAATIVWYAPYASNEVYEQANGRINRPSQTRTTNIFHIEASSLERDIYTKLQNRQKVQNSLLEYIKKQEM